MRKARWLIQAPRKDVEGVAEKETGKPAIYPKEENGKIAKTLQVMQLQRHGYPRTTDSCSPRG